VTTYQIRKYAAVLLASATLSTAAYAGPPYMTDDPEPTETGHWEIYGPLIEGAGRGSEFEGATGAEINYGPVKDVQLSLALPLAYSHDAAGWQWGAGDVEVSGKYRFYNDEDRGIQLAFFPAASIPTASHGMGSGKVTGYLPIWFQKDSGKWSVFGGGGYNINAGAGNRDFWSGGLAVTRQVSDKLQLGLEANREGADTISGHGSTSLGVGGVLQLKEPYRVIASGGPTFEDGGGKAGFHFFLALGLDY
jgi:hypothetical protein